MSGLTIDENDERLKRVKQNGQQEAYLILSAEERAKGFVRPLRRSYKHVGRLAPVNPLRELTESEHERYDRFGYVRFEAYPQDGQHVLGRFWTQEQLDTIGTGCGVVTTMSQEIAETYARNPQFYGATFCVGCGKHLPVGAAGEFVWEGTDERVGA